MHILGVNMFYSQEKKDKLAQFMNISLVSSKYGETKVLTEYKC